MSENPADKNPEIPIEEQDKNKPELKPGESVDDLKKIVDQQEKNGLEPRHKKLYSPKRFIEAELEMNKLDVKEIKNVSGDILLVTDLYTTHDRDKEGLAMQPNEVVDLTDLFTAKEINSSRRLREALGLKDAEGKPLYLEVVSTVSDPDNRKDVPDVVKKKLTRDDVNIFDAPPNEYDKKYAEVEKREREYNKSLRPIVKRGEDAE